MSPKTSRELSRLALTLLLIASLQLNARPAGVAAVGGAVGAAAVPFAGSITGRVVGEGDAAPVVGASVKALQSGTVQGSAVTGADGSYTLTGLPSGVYDLLAEAAGFRAQYRFGLGVAEGVATAGDFTLEAAGVRYVYDAQGRLSAVINPSGEAAAYSYDAAGNIQTLTRRDAGTVSVLGFTPTRGAAGTVVTIYGTGFGEGAGQHSVSFNGIAAQVLAASANQLTASAPPGVVTGPLSVTTPNGSATSSAPFVVAQDEPFIDGFAPTIGPAGTAVNIGGHGFETAALNNRVTFNVSRANVSAATATSIEAGVPSVAGSGRLAVTTPLGVARSAQDFFFTPPPYTAADVVLTGRVALGETRQIRIDTPGKLAIYVFEGVAGRRVSLSFTNIEFSSGNVTLYHPDGTIIDSQTFSDPVDLIGPYTLPVNGTYTVIIRPFTNNSGGLTFAFHDVPPDVSGPITPGRPGTPVAVGITTPGQVARLTFNGTANQKVQARVSGNTLGQVSVSLRRPDGTSITTSSSGNASFNGLARVLSADGVYTVLVDPADNNTGGLNVVLNDATDVTGTIVPGGPPVTVTTVIAEQEARLTFAGTAGQRVSLLASNNTAGISNVRVVSPTGTTLKLGSVGSGSEFVDPATLATTASNYAVEFDPINEGFGSITLKLYDVPPDFIAHVAPNDLALSVNITTPGQNPRVTFDGASGQQITVRITGSTVGILTLRLLRPDGTTLASSSFSGANFNLATQTLPSAGTYTVVVDPLNANTGSFNVRVTSP
jgi:YD repeat-containing protein